jgi:FMN reductase
MSAQDLPLVVGLGGSMSESSTSLAALQVALEGASKAGATVQLFDIRTLDLPMYRPGVEAPPAAQLLCQAVATCDAMIWSSPLYHGSISGSFKNALDWLQVLADRGLPYLQNKAVGLIATAGGVQGLQAVNTMEFIVRALRGLAIPLVSPISRAHKVFQSDGTVLDPGVADQLGRLGAEVTRVSRQLRREGGNDY